MSDFNRVLSFHDKFGQDVNAPITRELLQLRWNLLDEEFKEVKEEVRNMNEALDDGGDEFKEQEVLTRIAKELADLLYVTHGFAVTFGIPLDYVFEEVHRSNMSKLGLDGKPIYREDGKVLKGPNYHNADVRRVMKDYSV